MKNILTWLECDVKILTSATESALIPKWMGI